MNNVQQVKAVCAEIYELESRLDALNVKLRALLGAEARPVAEGPLPGADTVRGKVLRHFADGEPFSAADIRSALRVSYTPSNEMIRLIDEGAVERLGRGHFRVATGAQAKPAAEPKPKSLPIAQKPRTSPGRGPAVKQMILKKFADGRPFTVTGACAATDKPDNSVSSILSTMVAKGLLVRDEPGRFRVSKLPATPPKKPEADGPSVRDTILKAFRHGRPFTNKNAYAVCTGKSEGAVSGILSLLTSSGRIVRESPGNYRIVSKTEKAPNQLGLLVNGETSKEHLNGATA